MGRYNLFIKEGKPTTLKSLRYYAQHGIRNISKNFKIVDCRIDSSLEHLRETTTKSGITLVLVINDNKVLP